jgi:hypothetical protein
MKRNGIIAFLMTMALSMGVNSIVFGQEVRRPQNFQRQRQAQPDVLFLTPEQEAEVLNYLKEMRPEQSEELLKWKDRRPEQYRRALSRAFREMRYVEDLKERDPELYKIVSQEKQLESQSQTLARQYRNTDDEKEKKRIEEDLMKLLDQVFDLRQMNYESEIERLEKRLAEAKERNVERLANKSEIVQRRLEELLELKSLKW